MESVKKTKRTLVAINCSQLLDAKYDLRHLEGSGKLSFLLFCRGELKVWFDIRQDFRARTYMVPETEKNVTDYMQRTVLFEVGRMQGVRKVVFMDREPDRLMSAVQFLRDRNIMSEAYDFTAQPGNPVGSSLPTAEIKSINDGGTPTRVERTTDPNVDPLTGKPKRRRKVKMPTNRAHMELVMRALTRHLVPGQVYKRTAIAPIIHKETEMNVSDLFKHNNLSALYRYLQSEDVIEVLDKKSFRVLRNDWVMPPAA